MTDYILLWNEIALDANRISHGTGAREQAGPPLSARALAIVHLAMYDAVAGLANDPGMLPRYLSTVPSPNSGDRDAAITGAAYHALKSLFPSQEPIFDRAVRASGLRDRAGFGFGVDVAKAILKDREADPDASDAGAELSKERGRHRSDPDNPGQVPHAPHYGRQARGFAITERFALAAPPLDDDEYRLALREVRYKGIKPDLMGTLPLGYAGRTPDETLIGLYWAYDGAFNLGTPPRLYNQVVRQVAQQQKNCVEANARLFALVNVAMADAGILAWEQKYHHDLWRPVVAIREHDLSMGPSSGMPRDLLAPDCDPCWLPLGAPASNSSGKNFTPGFPAYPSGHACFGAAALHMTRLFYGQGGTLAGRNLQPDSLFAHVSFVSEELNGSTRDNQGAVRPLHKRAFPGGLWQMIEENGRSRVYLGVHFVFDAFTVTRSGVPDLYRQDAQGRYFGGVPLGLQIAENIFQANGRAPSHPGA
jgi:membrane-associated phospholipid phosphatase